MNNTHVIDLSVNELRQIVGGDDADADPRLKCYLLGAGFAVGILTYPAGLVGAALAGYSAYESGCLNW